MASGEPNGASKTRLARILHFASWAKVRAALAGMVAVLSVAGIWLNGEDRAGAFFGSGAAVLVLLLGEIRHRLAFDARSAGARRGLSLAKLSALNTARHPGRSVLTIGLVASASFLIIAMSAFRLETSDSGTGGFDLLATSDQPVNYDLNTSDGRLDQSGQFSDDDEAILESWQIYSLRVHSGEDASCLNLYRPSQPTVLGVPDAMILRGGFEWAAVSEDDPVMQGESNPSPWNLLHAVLGEDENGRRVIPVIIDANTATYSLQIGGIGARLTIDDDADRSATLEVVALLKNSILQGKLLLSEESFTQLYPETSGFRFFLMEAKANADRKTTDGDAVSKIFESRLADEGFDATPARKQLAEFLAVQNTYLSTFQSLGALGLLLGTIGLAVVQLRSVLERRGELALMRAVGFRRARLVRMVLWENAVLLLGGLAIGVIAAAVALLPQWGSQAASVPWRTLAALLGTIAVVGLAAGWLATRSALRAPIVPALRGD
jgi:hypothetical protein